MTKNAGAKFNERLLKASKPKEPKKEDYSGDSFPVHVLPRSFQHEFKEAKENQGFSYSWQGAALLALTTNLIDAIMPTAPGGDPKPCALQSVLVGESNSGKSKCADKVTNELHKRNMALLKDYEDKEGDYKKELAKFKLLSKDEQKEAIENNTAPEPPELKALMSDAATIEGLQDIKNASDGRILICSDEFDTVLSMLTKYRGDGGSEIANFIKLIDGDAFLLPYRSKKLHIKGGNTSLIGGLQPQLVYKQLLSENLKAKGLVGRFLFALPRHFYEPEYKGVNRFKIKGDTVGIIYKNLTNYGLESRQGAITNISTKVWDAFAKQVERIQKFATNAGKLDKYLPSIIGKGEGLLPRIAACLCFLEHFEARTKFEKRPEQEPHNAISSMLITEQHAANAGDVLMHYLNNIVSFIKGQWDKPFEDVESPRERSKWIKNRIAELYKENSERAHSVLYDLVVEEIGEPINAKNPKPDNRAKNTYVSKTLKEMGGK